MTTATHTALSHIGVIGVPVRDQDEALAFYVEKLGLEKRADAPMGEGMRWVTVATPGSATEIVLESGFGPETGREPGKWAGIIFASSDIKATHRELTARGVKFTEEPTLNPWGWWASFVDQDGNGFGLHQMAEG